MRSVAPTGRPAPRPARRPVVGTAAMVVVVLAVLVAACSSGSSHPAGRPPATTHSTKAPAVAPATTANPGTTAPAGAVPVNLYFVHGAGLGAVSRGVPAAGAEAAIRALLSGPSPTDTALGATTVIPSGTTLRGVMLAGTTATVDLSAAFAGGAPLQSEMRSRVAEVVFTVTQFPGVSRVAFAIDGKPVRTIGTIGFMVDPPLSRLDLTEALDTVLADAPAPGTVVASPMTVRGMSDTFEAQVHLRLLDARGHVLADTSTQATSGNGVWGTFSAQVTFAKPTTATGALEVFDASEGDGAGQHGEKIPIRFG